MTDAAESRRLAGKVEKSFVNTSENQIATKRDSELEKSWFKRLDRNKSGYRSHYRLAINYLLMNNRAQGLEALEHAVKLNPESAKTAYVDPDLTNLRSAIFYGILEQANSSGVAPGIITPPRQMVRRIPAYRGWHW